jgi:hypothetical protein
MKFHRFLLEKLLNRKEYINILRDKSEIRKYQWHHD